MTWIRSILFLLTFFGYVNAQAQSRKKALIGAYYFDGWTKLENNFHLTPSLTHQYNDRQPRWGWLTSSQEVIDAQIVSASNAGLHFFSFCWYYNKKLSVDSTNRALMFYNRSSVKNKLKFCITVVNHQGYHISQEEWPAVVKELLKQFKQDTYLTVDGQPLLIFFSSEALISKFGSTENVKSAFEELREEALRAGFKGVKIAACIGPGPAEIKRAEISGFDLLTGYNYHPAGIKLKNQQNPIDSMQSAEISLWNRFPKLSKLKYIPVSTLNWDPRPWANKYNNYDKAGYFIGFSATSVYRSVRNCLAWLDENTDYTPSEKIGLLYAWNEYGEGAWLSPSKTKRIAPIQGLRKALK